ncbi:hypothetical protein D9M68_993290 [compost metagenome]
MPALAKFMAIPPPMVPAPMTATRLTGRIDVPVSNPGNLPTSRSAKNTWRRASDSVEASASLNSSPSRARPSASGKLQAASIAATTRCGALWPFQRD